MEFNYHSKRARQARFAKLFDHKYVRVAVRVSSLLVILLWMYVVWVADSSAGHLLLIIPGILIPPLLWYVGLLKNLPVSDGSSIDACLDRQLLAHLPNNPSPQLVARLVADQNAGRFFAARFAIMPEALDQLSSPEPGDMSVVWQQANELKNRNGVVSDAAVLVALLKSNPIHEQYLAQLNLTSESVMDGLRWYEHIQVLLKDFEQRKNHGGIGRDLSFGWTPLLSRVGHNISLQVESSGHLSRQIEGHQEVLTQMIHSLSQPGRRNAALVGQLGVGKSTLVYALAQKLLEDKPAAGTLAYHQIVELNSAQLISQAPGRGELEALLIRIFNEAAHAKNIILFLDEAQLFMQEGQGSVDLTNILLQVLDAGGIQIILAMSDQEWLSLSQRNPGLSQLMNRIVVSPLNEHDTMRVIENHVLLLEGRQKVITMYQALTEAYKLSERFINDQALPGKAIGLLESATGFLEEGEFVTEQSVQQAIEKSYGVKVQTASSAVERDTLLNLEEKIHERMVNQTRAVQVVSDALRRARAGVRNQSRPIGTFLFLGPTGVGKTELSKALADVYFGGQGNIVRIDMNEYSQEQDVARLIATPVEYPDSLCAQIAKQPFSVVLLDEIEKAHPNVLNVLLQALDEGILRDNENRQVSFRDAIIIATSNAGADRIRAHIDAGEQLESFEESFVNELINDHLFKPEFLNRFDEIVLFRPLSIPELTQIVDLIVVDINKTLSAQKISIELTVEAKQLLAETGYDPRLGARPLRRVAQRSIENIVAQKVLAGMATPGSVISLDAQELQAALDKR